VLARAWGPIAAIGATALAFAALHVAGGGRAPLTLVNLLLGGILFGLLAWRSGGLAAPIAAMPAGTGGRRSCGGSTPIRGWAASARSATST
jgi:membrane protease YdiL (CAAX protease family)